MIVKEEKFWQVLSGEDKLQNWFDNEDDAKEELEQCEEFWPGEGWHIEEGTEYIYNKCRGCEHPNSYERHDAHNITTGYWCDECYDSNKYPYRKDKYPTIETHGFGERLDDDY